MGLLPSDLKVEAPLPVTLVHRPERPGWGCAGCRQPWPCWPVREALLEEARTEPTNVRLYLHEHFARAAQDLPAVSAGYLRHRILGWVVSQ